MAPTDRRCTQDHLWVRKESDGTLTAGLTDYATKQLGTLVMVPTPAPRSRPPIRSAPSSQ